MSPDVHEPAVRSRLMAGIRTRVGIFELSAFDGG